MGGNQSSYFICNSNFILHCSIIFVFYKLFLQCHRHDAVKAIVSGSWMASTEICSLSFCLLYYLWCRIMLICSFSLWRSSPEWDLGTINSGVAGQHRMLFLSCHSLLDDTNLTELHIYYTDCTHLAGTSTSWQCNSYNIPAGRILLIQHLLYSALIPIIAARRLISWPTGICNML